MRRHSRIQFMIAEWRMGRTASDVQRRFATHFLRADAGNPLSQSSGTLRAHPEGAALPHHTGAGILTRTRRAPTPSQPAI